MIQKADSTASVKKGDTARIDTRNSILAQIEAALLSDKLELENAPAKRKAAGADPYNSGNVARAESGPWRDKRPR